jgi:hypothetical protein
MGYKSGERLTRNPAAGPDSWVPADRTQDPVSGDCETDALTIVIDRSRCASDAAGQDAEVGDRARSAPADRVLVAVGCGCGPGDLALVIDTGRTAAGATGQDAKVYDGHGREAGCSESEEQYDTPSYGTPSEAGPQGPWRRQGVFGPGSYEGSFLAWGTGCGLVLTRSRRLDRLPV